MARATSASMRTWSSELKASTAREKSPPSPTAAPAPRGPVRGREEGERRGAEPEEHPARPLSPVRRRVHTLPLPLRPGAPTLELEPQAFRSAPHRPPVIRLENGPEKGSEQSEQRLACLDRPVEGDADPGTGR